jgi:hypothetical protein
MQTSFDRKLGWTIVVAASTLAGPASAKYVWHDPYSVDSKTILLLSIREVKLGDRQRTETGEEYLPMSLSLVIDEVLKGRVR